MLAAPLATALLDSPLFDAARRPLLERHVAPTPVVWVGSARSQLAVEFWSFVLEQQQARPAQSTVFATPRLSERQARALCESASCAAGVALSPLESDAPVAGVRCEPSGSAVAAATPADGAAVARAIPETRRWVNEALAPGPLHLCPFTASDSLAGVKLEAFGIPAAGIAYGATAAASLPELLLEFWSITDQMLAAGQARTSSILLTAPAWDDDFAAWRDEVFPALEESVLASGLGRSIGVVCFHPKYEIPSQKFLARRPFGHMRSTEKLRRWLDEDKDPMAVSDDELAWAGAAMRHSPHATINVLWASQLEAAEGKRKSAQLYSANVRRLLASRGGG